MREIAVSRIACTAVKTQRSERKADHWRESFNEAIIVQALEEHLEGANAGHTVLQVDDRTMILFGSCGRRLCIDQVLEVAYQMQNKRAASFGITC